MFLKNLDEAGRHGAVPLTPGGDEYFRTSRGRRPRDVERARDDRAQDTGTTRELCLGQITKDGMTPQLHRRAEDSRSAARSTGRPTASRSSRSASSTDASDDVRRCSRCALQEAVLGRPEGLGQGQASSPTCRKPGKGVLDAAMSPDGKQLARRVQPRAAARSGSTSPSPTTSCCRTPRTLKVRACKVDLAARRPGAAWSCRPTTAGTSRPASSCGCPSNEPEGPDGSCGSAATTRSSSR